MVLIEDTRNQVGKHDLLNKQLNEMGHKVIRSKLVAGDYTILENQKTCIDTKKDIVELAGNICGKQHERVREETIPPSHIICVLGNGYSMQLKEKS